ncbi:hypothetical protein CsSME_00016046 [Camellia sinensis var. sinensis]
MKTKVDPPWPEFTPEDGRYDVIWVQWCIGHLVDDDFVSFFKREKDLHFNEKSQYSYIVWQCTK